MIVPILETSRFNVVSGDYEIHMKVSVILIYRDRREKQCLQISCSNR